MTDTAPETGYEPADRTGYTVVTNPVAEGGQTTYAVTRDDDGTGIGAFATEQEIDNAIAADREYVEQRDAERSQAEADAAAAAEADASEAAQAPVDGAPSDAETAPAAELADGPVAPDAPTAPAHPTEPEAPSAPPSAGVPTE